MEKSWQPCTRSIEGTTTNLEMPTGNIMQDGLRYEHGKVC